MGLWSFLSGRRERANESSIAAGSEAAGRQRIVRLQGGERFGIKVVGTSRYQDRLSAIVGGRKEAGADNYRQARLIPEPNNPKDKHAVRVAVSGRTVGYLSREHATDYLAGLRALGASGCIGECHAHIVGGWDHGAGDQGHFGVRLNLVWPLRLDPSQD